MPVYSSNEQREFFVWVDPNNFMVQQNLGVVGAFQGGPVGYIGAEPPDYLQFIANPNFTPFALTPFHNNVISKYRVEYHLELARREHPEFKKYPSRLSALFLLDSKIEALTYQEAHPDHVASRILKRCITAGPYMYSRHDAAWIGFFLETEHHLKKETRTECMHEYWCGERADQHGFMSHGKICAPKSVMEILFYGRVDFPNKNPTVAD